MARYINPRKNTDADVLLVRQLKSTRLYSIKFAEKQVDEHNEQLLLCDLKLKTSEKLLTIVKSLQKQISSKLQKHIQHKHNYYNYSDRLTVFFKILEKIEEQPVVRVPVCSRTGGDAPSTSKAAIAFVKSSECESPCDAEQSLEFQPCREQETAGAQENHAGDKTSITFDNRIIKSHIIRTSTAVGTSDDVSSHTMIAKPTTAIALDYKSVNKFECFRYLTKPEVYESCRLVLAYLQFHADDGEHLNGQSFVSVMVKLRSMGFPPDMRELLNIFIEFCENNGIRYDAILKDLEVYRQHCVTRRIDYLAQKSKNFREYYCLQNVPKKQ